jgi:hypothetical protein
LSPGGIEDAFSSVEAVTGRIEACFGALHRGLSVCQGILGCG